MSKRPDARAFQKEDGTWWDDRGRQICGANLKRPGRGIPCEEDGTRRCASISISRNNHRCKWHGARATGAPLKSGIYSKRLGRLAAIYDEYRNDERLADMAETLALMQVPMQAAAEGVAVRDTPRFREQAISLMEEVRAARDVESLNRQLTLLEDHLKRGASEAAALEVLQRRSIEYSKVQGEFGRLRLAAGAAMNEKEVLAVCWRFCQLALDQLPEAMAHALVEQYLTTMRQWGSGAPRSQLAG